MGKYNGDPVITKSIMECKTVHHTIQRCAYGYIRLTPDIYAQVQPPGFHALWIIKNMAATVNSPQFSISPDSVQGPGTVQFVIDILGEEVGIAEHLPGQVLVAIGK